MPRVVFYIFTTCGGGAKRPGTKVPSYTSMLCAADNISLLTAVNPVASLVDIAATVDDR